MYQYAPASTAKTAPTRMRACPIRRFSPRLCSRPFSLRAAPRPGSPQPPQLALLPPLPPGKERGGFQRPSGRSRGDGAPDRISGKEDDRGLQEQGRQDCDDQVVEEG